MTLKNEKHLSLQNGKCLSNLYDKTVNIRVKIIFMKKGFKE